MMTLLAGIGYVLGAILCLVLLVTAVAAVCFMLLVFWLVMYSQICDLLGIARPKWIGKIII